MEIGTEMSTESQSKEPLGWPELKDLKGKALKVLETALDEGTPRDQMQAAAMVKGMDDSNIKVEELRDKQARLDAGQPTEISDQATLGTAVADLADRLGSILGHGAGADQTTVRVVESREAAVQELPDRTEPSDADD